MRKMKTQLNIGSGMDYREGFINMDLGETDWIGNKIKYDVKHDMNKYPYPFEDNRFDYVKINSVLIYFKDVNMLIKELKRIMMRDGELFIRVPHFSSYGAYSDPKIKNRYCLRAYCLFVLFKNNGFNLIEKKFDESNKFINLFFKFINGSDLKQRIYERFFYGFLPAQDIVWRFKKK